jgi:hypothetical protein
MKDIKILENNAQDNDILRIKPEPIRLIKKFEELVK